VSSSNPLLPVSGLAPALLRWYDRHRRTLPWRALPGEAPDPYHVWLSEIMLQQTTVVAVIPYFERFLSAFPSVRALAAAEEGAVLTAWAGLGYYARARNLHACARRVAEVGGFPSDLEALRDLPGVGAYTAAAIAAIAFSVPVVPVDGNVERVTSRLFAVTEELPGAKRTIAAAAARLGEAAEARARPSDFAQALFDLGATICTPRPVCGLCPWSDACAARRQGIAETLPRKAPKPARPHRYGAHFWLIDAEDRVLLRRRPPRGLLGGMTELPGTEWLSERWSERDALAAAPMEAAWRPAGVISHVFTHFELLIDVYAARVDRIAAEGFLAPAATLEQEALPSVMRKCVRAARGDAA